MVTIDTADDATTDELRLTGKPGDPSPPQHPGEDPEHPSPVVGQSKPRLLSVLGPGLITGASDDDPSGIATYSQAGAQFGYALGWSMFICFPLMVAVQIVSARIGRTTGQGLARNLREHAPGWLLASIVSLVVFANVVNIGADLSAMGDSVATVAGGPRWAWILAFGAFSIGMQVFMQYTSYVSWLKWLTLALLAYVGTLFMAHVPWGEAMTQLVLPKIEWTKDYATALVAVLGTTISPYLFFWQASQEVEDIRAYPRREPLIEHPRQGRDALERIRIDTVVGMAVSNLVGLAIIFTTAATLHAHGVTDIATSADAARALEPIAGKSAAIVFALGVVGTGILAIPVLAGSAAYAIGEARGWKTGLGRKPLEAVSFYAAVALATAIGMVATFMPIDPMKALFWAAVVNGAVAVPVIGVMMSLAARRKVMGQFPVRGLLAWTGWATMGFMALATVTMVAGWIV